MYNWQIILLWNQRMVKGGDNFLQPYLQLREYYTYP